MNLHHFALPFVSVIAIVLAGSIFPAMLWFCVDAHLPEAICYRMKIVPAMEH